MSDHGTEPEEDRSQFKSSWAVEWKDEEKNTVEIKEENEYPRALTLFNELSGSGKDVVLYELRTLIANPSAQPRKIPVLNSIKAKNREALAEQKPRERESINRTTRSPNATKSSSLKDLRTRIFILIAVIATFVVILLLISVLFTGNDIVHQFLYVSSISYGQLNLACDYACVP